MNRCLPIVAALASGAALLLGACSNSETPITLAAPPAAAATAAQPAASAASEAAVPADTATLPGASPAGAGQRMYLDPVTGLARTPTAAEHAAEVKVRANARKAAEARVVRPTEEVVLPGGLTEVRVDRRADVQETVCLQPDGSLGRCPPAPPAVTNKPSPQ